jgi:gamma-glutamyl-gamma-aminobutyrate hydrolase PuuD
MKPRVLMVSRRLVRKNKTIDWVSEAHLSLLLREGLLPVAVPIVPEAAAALKDYAAGMAGLLLVEGGDIHPSHYGVRAGRTELDELDPVKDRVELWLCRQALRRGVPVLGICRGMQLLNVVKGGTLHLDVLKDLGRGLPHMMAPPRYDSYRHPVKVLPGTPLRRWYGLGELRVNSYHHQGVRRLAPGLAPMAVAPDGLVEAFYDTSHRFRVGLQFHPERMIREYAGNRRVFRAFAAAVRSSR